MTATSTASPSHHYSPSPSQVIDVASAELTALATTCSEDDIRSCVSPAVLTATPGENALAAASRSKEILLEMAQANSRTEMQIELQAANGIKNQVALGERVELPADFPTKRPVPLEFFLILLLGVVETVTLMGPIGQILDFVPGSIERLLIPGMVALISIILAHHYGTQILASKQSLSHSARTSAKLGAMFSALAVTAIGAMAVLARIYSKDLQAQLSGLPTSPQGNLFFALFQVTLVVGSIALSHCYFLRLSHATDTQRDSFIRQTAERGAELELHLEGILTEFGRQKELLDGILQNSVLAYRNALAVTATAPETRAAWSMRTRQDLQTDFIRDSVTSPSQVPSEEHSNAAPTAQEAEEATAPEPQVDLFRSITEPATDTTDPTNPIHKEHS
jgi:hypothetical protein